MTGRKLSTQPIDKKAMEPFLGRYQFESPRIALSGFIDRLQNAPSVYFKNDKLYFKPLIGPPTELVQTAPFTFAWQDTNMPLICFTKNDDGKNVMLIGGIYHEQTSNFLAILKRAIILLAVIFSLSSIFIALFSLFKAVTGKLAWKNTIPRIMPLAGISLLCWSLLHLSTLQQYSYRLSKVGTLNYVTIVIFLGTAAFAVISIAGLMSAIKTFRQSKNFVSTWLLLTNISLCLLMAILWQNGWIGLRTWAL